MNSLLPWRKGTTGQQNLISGQGHTAWKNKTVMITPTKAAVESYSFSEQSILFLPCHLTEHHLRTHIIGTNVFCKCGQTRLLQLHLFIQTEDLLLFPALKYLNSRTGFSCFWVIGFPMLLQCWNTEKKFLLVLRRNEEIDGANGDHVSQNWLCLSWKLNQWSFIDLHQLGVESKSSQTFHMVKC